MRSRKAVTFALFTVLVVAVPVAASSQGFKIVANEANASDAISKQELSNVFMKKKNTWSDGLPVLPVDQAADSATRHGFSRVIFGRDASAIKTYWQRQIFSGKGVPPPEMGSDDAVLSYVREHPGAIGYVSSSADVGPGVKVLEIGKK
jgi:ABC-type phosphate transport system substrate-binding protein